MTSPHAPVHTVRRACLSTRHRAAGRGALQLFMFNTENEVDTQLPPCGMRSNPVFSQRALPGQPACRAVPQHPATISTNRCCITAPNLRAHADLTRGVQYPRSADRFREVTPKKSNGLCRPRFLPQRNSLPPSTGPLTTVFSSSRKALALRLQHATPSGRAFIRGRCTAPIERPLPYLDPTGIAFHGTADPWSGHRDNHERLPENRHSLYLTENANHSMETGDTLHDIFILHDIMDETTHWMDSTT